MASLTYRHVPAVDKAARLLAALRGGEPLGISELARRIDASKGTVRDVLLTLAAHGLVLRDPDGRFRVDVGRGRLRDLAHDAVVALARESGETAFLGIVERDAIVIAEVVESRSDPHMSARVGWRVPATVGAHAKVLGQDEPIGLDDEEYLEGVRAAAAPILDPAGRKVGVLIVVGFKSRVTLERLRRLGKIVAAHASAVTERLQRRAA